MVEAIFEASETFLDGFVGDFELCGGDASVGVFESDAVGAPDECRAFGAAARGALGSAFAGFGGFAGFGDQPVERARRRGEVSLGCGLQGRVYAAGAGGEEGGEQRCGRADAAAATRPHAHCRHDSPGCVSSFNLYCYHWDYLCRYAWKSQMQAAAWPAQSREPFTKRVTTFPRNASKPSLHVHHLL